jgi:hypothetical protein
LRHQTDVPLLHATEGIGTAEDEGDGAEEADAFSQVVDWSLGFMVSFWPAVVNNETVGDSPIAAYQPCAAGLAVECSTTCA